ncbi:hypothetical protein BDZ88DRAFT_422421 [Geranomyces variabilis]|nr:hypothetical protein BDZ88DRAFT_422421 [Geranomyces variabilis]KAJ3137587.1 hypothetical protein HDU90_001990 [Geranomyces variabilis]
MSTSYHGTFIHAVSPSHIEILPATTVVVSDVGVITHIVRGDLRSIPSKVRELAPSPIILGDNEFFIPGFVDTHVHAPQYAYAGAGTHVPLMTWLTEYAFPTEVKMRDPDYAQEVYSKLVHRMVANGTTTALYFATIDVDPCIRFAKILQEKGQRAFVGKVCMDRNAPPEYVETTAESLSRTEEFFTAVAALQTDLIEAVVTPRFIPTCTPELLRGLGELAERHGARVQSHLSESRDEVAFVEALHPGEGSDSDIFAAAGLITSKTVMAHSIYLSDNDEQLLRARGCGLAVCPMSNYFFAGSTFPIRERMDKGLKCGLGTDVAGGYSPSMLQNIRALVLASRGRNHYDSTALIADYKCGFYVATRGGAAALGLEGVVGGFAVGMQFDALRIKVGGPSNPVDVFPGDDWERKFEKFVNLGDERSIKGVWVKGRQIA